MIIKFSISLSPIFSALLLINVVASAQNLSRDSLEIVINQLELEPNSLDRDSTLAFFYNDMCEKCVWGNDPRADEFLDRFEKSYQSLAQTWKPAEALYYRARGKSFEKAGDYEKTVDLYLKAVKILEKYPADPKHLTFTYILTGFLMTNNGNTEECKRIFKKAEPFALKEKNKANIIWIYDWFADVIYNEAKSQEDFKEALRYYKIVEEFIPFTNVDNQKSNNFEGLGKTYWKLGNRKLGKSYFDKAIAESKKNNEGFNLWNIYCHLAYLEEADNDLTKAIENSEKALASATEFGYSEFITRTHFDLIRLYKKSKNFEKSLLNFEIYQERTDSLGRNNLNAKYKELEGKYNSEIQANKIEKLENNRLQLIGYAILGILGMGFIGLVYYRSVNKKLKLQNQLLIDKNKEIKNAIKKGSQQERKRVANDLHDGLATKITALKWRMEAEKPIGENSFIVEELEKLYTDVRLIAHNMAATEFHAIGLIPSIEGLISKLNLIEKTSFIFENKLPNGQRFDHDLAYQLYCIVLELSTNIMKHSDAEAAILSLKQYDGNLILSMSDDGTLIKKGRHTGMGLMNLKERVRHFKGNVVIRDDEGFEVYIEIPLTTN